MRKKKWQFKIKRSQKLSSTTSLFAGESIFVDYTHYRFVHSFNSNCEKYIYRGGFDNKMNHHGYEIEYNRESGKEKFEGYWEKE